MKRTFTVVVLVTLLIAIVLSVTPLSNIIQAAYVPPTNNRVKFNFNYGWRFCRVDLNAKSEHPENINYTESATYSWQNVSLPHCFNDIDSWREWCGFRNDTKIESRYEGKVWYRKHFTVDAAYIGRKIILECEGISKVGDFWVNGQFCGYHENSVGPAGIDITNAVNFGADNVIALQVNNSFNYKMRESKYNGANFPYAVNYNPNYGGLRDINLHIFDKLYQTLPLYRNLGTVGTYVYPQQDTIDTLNKTANITMQAEVKNEYTTSKTVSFDATVVDRDGNVVLTATGPTKTLSAGASDTFSVTAPMINIYFWAPDFPYLYKVYTSLKVSGTTVDVDETPLGVRKVIFSAADGLRINGHPIFLKGYAPRTSMEWPTAGIPPDWMNEYDFKLMHENNGNFCRPMHLAPRKIQVEAGDKFGVIMVCPAACTEGAGSDGNEWNERLDIMRDVTIYFRNNPSVLFYEGCNSTLPAAKMDQMWTVKNTWDPYGGRFAGTRGCDDLTHQEYGSPMDNVTCSTTIPHWDAEYARGECSRRVWDEVTPVLNPRWDGIDPNTKYVTGGYYAVASDYHRQWPLDSGTSDFIGHYLVNGYFRLQSSEELAIENVYMYWARYSRSAFVRPLADRLKSGILVGGAKIILADSTTDGRMYDMEIARCSGLLDGARIPKEAYYALQVVQNDAQSQVYILGHWNHTAGIVKTMYVISNTPKVKLLTYDTNGNLIKDYGFGTLPPDKNAGELSHYAFRFTNVAWQPGTIKAIGYQDDGTTVLAHHEKSTVGPPVKIKLTSIVGPDGSLRADGSDIAMINVEVVDANGNRCPTYEDQINFNFNGQGLFLGGYNGAFRYTTNQDYRTSGYHLNVECGINRVFVRSTMTAGSFTLTASDGSGKGLTSDSITINSIDKIGSTPIITTNGLSTIWPQKHIVTLGTEPQPISDVGGGPTPLPTATPNPNALITELHYTGVHSDQATVVQNVQDGMQVYKDNSCTFQGLPSYLKGGEYIQAFLSDAGETSSSDQYQFNLSMYSNIYQLIDAANDMPLHNYNEDYGWQLLPETITINGRVMKIYKSRLMAPYEQGYFAVNGKTTRFDPNSNMYIVFAVTAEQELQKLSGVTVSASTYQAATYLQIRLMVIRLQLVGLPWIVPTRNG